MSIFGKLFGRNHAAGRKEADKRRTAALDEVFRREGMRANGLEEVHDGPTIGEIADSDDDLAAFLYLGVWKKLASSNVAAAKYEVDEQILTIEYLDGSIYGYANVTEDQARELFMASSPGGFVWDELRQRGSVFGFQHEYWLISGPTKAPQRKWMATEETQRAHGRIRPAGERGEKFPFSPKKRKR